MEAMPFTNNNVIDRAWYNDLEPNRNHTRDMYSERPPIGRTVEEVEVGRTVAMETAGKVLGDSS